MASNIFIHEHIVNELEFHDDHFVVHTSITVIVLTDNSFTCNVINKSCVILFLKWKHEGKDV